MKLTLVEIVQDILNDMDSDRISSISDTEEGEQVAQIVRTTYFEMIGRRDWKHLFKLSSFNSINDNTKPTHLNTPENMARLDWFKYNKKKTGDTRNRYEDIDYLEPLEFIQKTNSRNLDKDNVEEIVDFDGARFQVFNDIQPKYYTSFDDRFIVLDSYDKTVESTVQGLNSQVYMYTIPSWITDDSFIPDLPLESFPALLAEAKSVASFKLADVADSKAEQQSVRQQKRLSVNGWAVKGGINFPNYGRTISRTTSTNLLDKT